MKAPVNIQTKEGLEYWKKLSEQFYSCRQKGMLDWFYNQCLFTALEQEREVIAIADSDDWDKNPEMLQEWKVKSDIHVLTNYFGKIGFHVPH